MVPRILRVLLLSRLLFDSNRPLPAGGGGVAMRLGPGTDSDLDSAILGGAKDAGKEDEVSACNAIVSGRGKDVEQYCVADATRQDIEKGGRCLWDGVPKSASDAVFKAQRLLRRARGPDRQRYALYQVDDPAAFGIFVYCRQRLCSERCRAIRRFGIRAEANGEE